MTSRADGRGQFARRRRWFFMVAVAALVAALVISSIVGWHLLSGGPSEHHNPSFRYGEAVMRDELYGSGRGDPEAVCRSAMAHPVGPPANFDQTEAIAGCKYQEYLWDN